MSPAALRVAMWLYRNVFGTILFPVRYYRYRRLTPEAQRAHLRRCLERIETRYLNEDPHEPSALRAHDAARELLRRLDEEDGRR